MCKKDITAVLQIHKGAHSFHNLISQFHTSPLTRYEVGKVIRLAGEHFELSLVLGACLWYLEQALGESARQSLHLQPVDADLAFEIEKLHENCGFKDLAARSTEKHFSDPSKADQALLDTLATADKIMGLIEGWNLTQVYAMQPLLNGKVVIEEFPLLQGPPMTDVMNSQIEWQLQNPQATSEDMLKYLGTKYAQFVQK